MDDGAFKESAFLEILDEGRRRLVDSPTEIGKLGSNGIVVIPGLAAEKELDEANASFDESSGNEASRTVLTRGIVVEAVEFFGMG